MRRKFKTLKTQYDVLLNRCDTSTVVYTSTTGIPPEVRKVEIWWSEESCKSLTEEIDRVRAESKSAKDALISVRKEFDELKNVLENKTRAAKPKNMYKITMLDPAIAPIAIIAHGIEPTRYDCHTEYAAFNYTEDGECVRAHAVHVPNDHTFQTLGTVEEG